MRVRLSARHFVPATASLSLVLRPSQGAWLSILVVGPQIYARPDGTRQSQSYHLARSVRVPTQERPTLGGRIIITLISLSGF